MWFAYTADLQVALTDEQLEKMAVPSGELIAVEGTKLKISRKLYAHTEMIKKNAVRLVSFLKFVNSDEVTTVQKNFTCSICLFISFLYPL